MIDHADWQKADDEYLAVGLEWLRLRLARMAPSEQARPETSASPSLPTKGVRVVRQSMVR